ncbi:sugar ABC transporter ATP-binding protein [Desulfopila aestuarii]|uniref:Erythritol transport system ATP-binding protein n=1 Tax=Desulfopila aestuarii DSM 18488 TaxID=1121416 RepID=A0A1M7XVU4_9BACT|nr:sugar ABC transporter ATP-binding protein [Desulfopila aestuarii]SHO42813.1 erythritol transport system ATP-binding protein [Desulfopila aestuarii DSM 18488]
MSENENGNIILKARDITKLYPGTVALNGVDFNVYRGKVNVLVGENGAGKSTLTKILAGVEVPTKGVLQLEGEDVRIQSFHDAASYGIGMIHQELNLFPNMNVAENIFVAREIATAGIHIDHKTQVEHAQKLLDRLEADIDATAQVADLRIGQQQMVEIAKALALDTRILIMDEPTSALSAAEVDVLFRVIGDLKKHGVSIVYISHRLEELVKIGDYITVLRDGNLMQEAPMKDIDVPWIIANMVGDDNDREIKHASTSTGEEVLRVENLRLARVSGGFTVDHLNFTLCRGEILGIYGLMGAGRSELFECLMGLQKEVKGNVLIEGKDITIGTVDDHIRAGLALIPEDRQREGLVQVLDVSNNMTLSSIRKFRKWIHIQNDKLKKAVHTMISDLSIKVASPQVLISSLSGGNQQKVVIGKALLTEPKVLLMDEPTRGIDVGAKGDVFGIMNKLAARGLGIIFVTSELKEIMAISDRIMVMSKGKITGEYLREEATEEMIVAASASGHKVTEHSLH